MIVKATIPENLEVLLIDFKKYNDITCTSTALVKLAEFGAKKFFNDDVAGEIKMLKNKISVLEKAIDNMAADLARLTTALLDGDGK